MTIKCYINDDKRSLDHFELEIKAPTLTKIKKELKKAGRDVAKVRSDYWIQTEPFVFEDKTYSWDDGNLDEE